jgi:nucleoside-diphosphate-sugar epimerase
MDRRCLVAGCGYVGRRLAERMRPAWRVIALARSPANVAALRAAGIEAIAVDLDSGQPPRELRSLADGGAVAYLVPPPDSGATDPRLEGFLAALGDARPQVLLYMSRTGV